MRISKNNLFAAMKRRFVVRALSLLMLVSILSIAQAHDVQVLQIKEKSADAIFSSLDSTGCIQTDFVLILSSQKEKIVPDGYKIFVPSVNVFLSVFDACHGGTPIRSAFGITESFTYDFGGNLDPASVQAVIPVVDDICLCSYDIAVNFNWIGQGDITASRSRDTFTSPGMTVVTRFKGSFREAVAGGTVNIVGSSDNLTPSGSQISAALQNLQAGILTVIRD